MVLEYLKSHIIRNRSAEFDKIEEWRENFSHLLDVFLAIVMPVLLALLLRFLLSEQNYIIIGIIAYFWIVCVYRAIRRKRNYLHSFIILYALEISGLLAWGPIFAIPALMVSIVVLFTMIYGTYASVVAVILNALILHSIYLFIGQDLPSWSFIYKLSFMRWLVVLINISIVSLITCIPVGLLLEYMYRIITDEQDLRKRLQDETGNLHRTNEVLENEISRRIHTEHALMESEQNMRDLADSLPQMVFETDVNGIITFVNRNGFTIFGYNEEDLGRGIQVLDIISPHDRERAFMNMQKVLNGESLSGTEYLALRKDGAEFPIRTYTLPIMRGDKPNGARGILIDTTEEKKAIEEKEQLQTQLMRSQRMESIGTLAGGIAHDFNNILSAVIGYAELLKMKITGEEKLSEYVGQILKAGKRAKELVQQILTFSRQVKKELKPVQVKTIVKEALTLLRASLPATIDIQSNLESDALVHSDPTQIHQVLMNLCTNASHAMKEKGGILRVELKEEMPSDEVHSANPGLKPGTYLKLSVSDTGHGIHPSILPRIFDPFFTTKGKGEGTGMGLAVVHGIILDCGGTIDVSSIWGEGTCISVYLPAIQESGSLEAEAEAVFPRGTERILLVDDEKILVDMWSDLLVSLGYKVTARTSSIEALSLFEAAPDAFDIVISDMTMPGMTGDELTQKILAVRPEMPVILCTGFSERISEGEAREIGIRHFAMKPLVLKDLSVIVRSALGGRT